MSELKIQIKGTDKEVSDANITKFKGVRLNPIKEDLLRKSPNSILTNNHLNVNGSKND